MICFLYENVFIFVSLNTANNFQIYELKTKRP